MTMRELRIAVTGASGFCGAEVARTAAARGADVVCLGRRPGPVGQHIRWDASRDEPNLAGADAVIHLAAAVGDPGPGDDARYHAVNVAGTRRLLDAAGTRPVVWVSSASVYDPGTDRSRVPEDHPVGRQLSAYGRTKAAGERLALGAGAVVLRPRAVYGAHRIEVRIRHVPVVVVDRIARLVEAAYRLRPRGEPWLTRYAVDQVAHDVVLDIGKATAQGWRPHRTLDHYLHEVVPAS